jgi:hypothetical protein
MLNSSVGEVQIIGFGRVLGGHGVNLLDIRQDAVLHPVPAYFDQIFLNISALFQYQPGELEIGITHHLGLQ